MQSTHDPYQALRFRDFRFFIVLKLFITLAIQIQALVVGWQLYAITNDPLSLGLIGLVEAVPALSVALFAGYIADRFNRKRIMQWCYLILTLSASLLALFSLHTQYFLANFGTSIVYFAVFLNGLARGFHSPANSAFMTQLIPKEAYINSASWSSTIWEIGSITGPALAGAIYIWQGATTAYAVMLSFIFIAFLAVSFIPSKPLPANTMSREPIFESIKAGVSFVFNHQIMLSAISLDLFAVLFGGAVALLPVFAKDILHVDALELGIMRATPAVGALLTAFITAYLKPSKNAGRILLTAVAGFGLATIGFALSTHFYLSLLMLFLIGAFDSVSVIIRSTIMQVYTPDEMRGRVSSVNSMFIGSSNELGAFESGTAARLMGTAPSVVFGGCMTLLVVAATYLKAPKIRTLSFEKEG